jgi:hypothetical protein
MQRWRIIGPIDAIETIAKGRGIRELRRLTRVYGGKNWRKKKGLCQIAMSPTGKVLDAEIHWYEAHGVGRVEWKIKKWL